MNIIAIDSEDHARSALERAIRSASPNSDIFVFADSHSALQYAAENKVDVAFMDVMLKGISGIELARKLKELHE